MVEIGGPREVSRTIASGVADAAAARMLIFDELPDDERPRPDDRVLLVGLVWGGSTLVELEPIPRGADLAAGDLFDLPASGLPDNFRIVRHAGDGHVLTLPQALRAEVHGGGHVLPFGLKGRRVQAPFRGHSYLLDDDDRVVAQVTPSLTLIARYVRAARLGDRSLFRGIDLGFALTLLLALAALVVFFRMVSRVPDVAPFREPPTKEFVARYQAKPVEKPAPPPKPKDLSGAEEGDKSRGDEGKLGKPEAKQKEAAPSRPGAPQVDPKKKEHDLARVRRLGLIAALSKMGVPGGGAAGALLGAGGLGGGIQTPLRGPTGPHGPGAAPRT